MAKHYYAVKDGRNIGVYMTWSECKSQVDGYSGAVYKKFSNYEEALEFIDGQDNIPLEKDVLELGEKEMVAYVDGSFDGNSNYYSYGAVIFTHKGKETYAYKENDMDMVDMRNVAGEIKGAMYAMGRALEKGKHVLYLHYDYMGIEKWALGEWKTNKIGTKMYKEYYDSIQKYLDVIFIKVEAHSGVQYNEEADKLAKEVLGI